MSELKEMKQYAQSLQEELSKQVKQGEKGKLFGGSRKREETSDEGACVAAGFSGIYKKMKNHL